MIDSIQGFSKFGFTPDQSFKRLKNGYLKKYGFNFKLANNGYLNLYGQLSEFYNLVNGISDTNYPLIPIHEIEDALLLFEDVFGIRLNDIDIKRIDFAVDIEYQIFIDLNNLDLINKNYTVKYFDKLNTSVTFSQKKDNNIRLVFYQNESMNRKPGIRFETRFLKRSVPFRIASEIKSGKIIDFIIPFMEMQVSNLTYKESELNIDLEANKYNYSQLKNHYYSIGLISEDNKTFNLKLEYLKANGMDRHTIKRIRDERNSLIVKNESTLHTNPKQIILKTINNVKNGL